MIGTLLDMIEATGAFATGCCEWRKRPVNEQPLVNFNDRGLGDSGAPVWTCLLDESKQRSSVR
jgi:hypothetical protein